MNEMRSIEAAPPGAAGAGARDPWWGRTGTMLFFMLLSTVPLWFTSLPPLIDFIGHMGRYRIQLDIETAPELARHWSYEWALVGNLGVDLLIVPLSWLFGLERAAWIVAAALPPLMIWGIYRATKAIYGEVPPTAIAALPFVLAYPYQYGFVNYWLACGLAFHALASWVRLQHRPGLRAAIFLPVGLVVWVCHVYGWGTMGVLIGGYQLSRVRATIGWPLAGKLIRAGLATWPLLIVLPLMVLWRENGTGAETVGWFEIRWKLEAALYTLRDQWAVLDVGYLIAVGALIYAALRDRRLAFDPRFGIPALIFLALLIIMPFRLFGSAFADSRIYPLLFIAALLAVSMRDRSATPRLAHALAGAAAALFVLRIGIASFGYAHFGSAYESHLKALNHVERGSSVAVLVRFPCDPGWRRPRLDHLGSMAIVRRNAFVNSQWDVPGAQLLRAEHAAGTDFNVDPSHFVGSPGCEDDLRPQLAKWIAKIPAGYYDYLWVFDFNPATLPAYEGWQEMYADERTILYRKRQ